MMSYKRCCYPKDKKVKKKQGRLRGGNDMFKKGIVSVLAASMLLGLAGCGSNAENENTSDTENNTAAQGFVEKKVEPENFDSGVTLKPDCYKFIYALGNAPATIDAANYFKMRLEQESDGALSVDVYTDNVLAVSYTHLTLPTKRIV